MNHTTFRSIAIGICCFAGCFSMVLAQGFIEPVQDTGLIGNNKAVVVVDGERIEGKITSGVFYRGFLKSVTIKDADGNKTKYPAEEVDELIVNVDTMMKMNLVTEEMENVFTVATADFEEHVNRDVIVFERALLPKKDKYRLLQLVNPGFDQVMKVYQDPNAKETNGMFSNPLRQGDPKSFLVVQGGEKSIVVKKDGYKKQFQQIFGECGVMVAAYKDTPTKFKNFAEHVFAYDQLCSEEILAEN